jgi:hypothetical protein
MKLQFRTNTVALTPSWELVPKNFALVRTHLEQIALIVILPILLLNLGTIVVTTNRSLGWIVILLGIIWWLINLSASYYLQVTAAKAKTITTADCYQKSWRYFGRLILFTILFSCLVLIGFVLLIIPGLVILRRYCLTTFYIVDQNLSIREAMSKSAAQTKPVAGYVWGTLGVVLVLTLAVGLLSSLFDSIPGATVVLSSLLAPAYLFLLALRYVDITSHIKTPST